jgi:NitT/TauT family transport system permease protein
MNKINNTNKINKNINKKNIKKNKLIYSKEYRNYISKQNRNKIIVTTIQIGIIILFLAVWELVARFNIIDVFIFSSPSKIGKKLAELTMDGSLIYHIGITLNEALIGFLIATFFGSFIAIILWWNTTLRKILDPFIVVLNSLPKIALGPIIIIWFGIGLSAIVFMDILIMIIITILSMMNAFNNCDQSKIMLLKSMNANKLQVLYKLVIPNAWPNFLSVLKINVGLTWVGTIMGEYLVSQAGLGYLIDFGGVTFQMDLIMASTFVLCLLAALMYFIVANIGKIIAFIKWIFVDIRRNKILKKN